MMSVCADDSIRKNDVSKTCDRNVADV
jgi:hypothetical protein